jgi:hypothetical protein
MFRIADVIPALVFQRKPAPDALLFQPIFSGKGFIFFLRDCVLSPESALRFAERAIVRCHLFITRTSNIGRQVDQRIRVMMRINCKPSAET